MNKAGQPPRRQGKRQPAPRLLAAALALSYMLVLGALTSAGIRIGNSGNLKQREKDGRPRRPRARRRKAAGARGGGRFGHSSGFTLALGFVAGIAIGAPGLTSRSIRQHRVRRPHRPPRLPPCRHPQQPRGPRHNPSPRRPPLAHPGRDPSAAPRDQHRRTRPWPRLARPIDAPGSALRWLSMWHRVCR